MLKVKICGLTNLEDAVIASDLGADAVGFIFSKKSPRYIGKDKAKKIINQLDPFLTKVGVFVDEQKQKVFDLASELGLDVLQFHGKETPSYCNFFKPKFKVIKVFFLQDRPYKEIVDRYKADVYMFDVKYEDKIKMSSSLTKDALEEISKLIKCGLRVVIAGGLNVENVTRVKKLKPYAVDVASGIERLVGKKDKNLVSRFIKKVKQD